MGIQLSKTIVTDPAKIGTKVTSDADAVTNSDTKDWKRYDYIVIGGGTAGCVVASRLTEDKGVTVLLIEAGKSQGGLLTRMPLAFTKSYETDVDWAYSSTPQKHMEGKTINWPRGKVLGGTSVLNANIYTRGSPSDYDQWEKAGATGWSYQELEKYFRKVERFDPSRPHFSKIDFMTKGTTGPVEVGQTEHVAPILEKIDEACRALNVPFIDDINAPDAGHGFTYVTGTVDGKGERVSASTAYLTPDVISRPNLTIATNVIVEKILFSETTPLQAMGVQLTASQSGPRYLVAVTKEVILSAGVFGSPQLLLVSGVGPKEELASLGVRCLKDSPHVGEHLLDHPSSGPMIFRTKPGVTIDSLNSPLAAVSALLKWLVNGSGPMSKMGVTSVVFLRSDDTNLVDTTIGEVKNLASGPTSPDIEIMLAPAIVPYYTTTGRPGENGITIASVALKAESEGSVTLHTASIWDKPDVDGNFFASESDVNVVLRGARFVMQLVRTEPLKSLMDLKPDDTDENSYFWPGDVDPDKITDDELRKWILRNGYPACHPVGTCRMGGSPENSVVDPKLKVHGISGLRVVDASIFPSHVSTHPVATIYAAAEKLVDMVRDE